MKRLISFFCIFVLLFPCFIFAEEKENTNNNLIANAKSGILIDYSSGKVIYEKNADEKMAMASLTKMISQIIILESIEKGNIKWNDVVTVSSNASSMGGSQIYLETGEKMTVNDLFKGVSVASANDAIVALAETVAGSEAEFVKLMNKKAKKLKLKNTNFINSSGLDEDNHYSTARDLAIIAKELLKHDKILDYSSIYEDYLRENTDNKFWLVNTNKLVRSYNGADGLKTGHTDNALYCIALTAKRNNLRLIGIVLGEENNKVRNRETTELLDYGFNLYKFELLRKKGIVMDKVTLDKGTVEKVSLILKDDLGVLVKKNDNYKTKYKYDIDLDDIKLPIKKGSIVGRVIVKNNNNEEVATSELMVNEDINKINIFNLFIRNLKVIFEGSM